MKKIAVSAAILLLVACGEDAEPGSDESGSENSNEVTREYDPYLDAGGPDCNDGYADFQCEPGGNCIEEMTANSAGLCRELASGDYQPYFEADGPPCNDGFATYHCEAGDTCIEEMTAEAKGLCRKSS